MKDSYCPWNSHFGSLNSLIPFLGDIGQTSFSSNSEFLDTSEFSVCLGSKCLAAFIDDVINNPHINILVLQASIAIVGRC